MNSFFFFVMIMHFCHSFCFQGHTYILHVKIMALDTFNNHQDQQQYIVNKKYYLYMLCFIFSLFIINIIMSNVLVFLTFGCVWVPQIHQNIQKNINNVPFLPYAFTQTLNILLLPLYMNIIDGNFLFLKPNYLFGLILGCWLAFQLLILFIQQSARPRFMLPQEMRERM